MRNDLQWLLGAVLASVMGTAAAAPHVDFISLQNLDPQALVSPTQNDGDQRYLGAFKVEKEETEKAELEIEPLGVVVLPEDGLVHGAIVRWVIAPQHPIDSLAAHAARGPPA